MFATGQFNRSDVFVLVSKLSSNSSVNFGINGCEAGSTFVVISSIYQENAPNFEALFSSQRVSVSLFFLPGGQVRFIWYIKWPNEMIIIRYPPKLLLTKICIRCISNLSSPVRYCDTSAKRCLIYIKMYFCW